MKRTFHEKNPHNVFLPILCAAFLMCVSTPSVFAVSGESGGLTGSHIIDGDLVITVNAPDDPRHGIEAKDGESVTLAPGSENAVVTINLNGEGPEGSVGIAALTGAVVDIGKLIVTGDNAAFGVHAHGDGSSVNIGDGSVLEIVRFGSAAVAEQGGTITIGNNARLMGNSDSDLVLASASTITIGDGATIVNDRTAIAGTGPQQPRVLVADFGGSITIGNDAEITNMGNSANGLEAVSIRTGSTGVIGDRANIHNSVDKGYGVASRMDGSHLTIGEQSKITTTKDSSFGVLADDGGRIMLKSRTQTETFGNNSNALYSYFDGASGATGYSFIETGDDASTVTHGANAWGVASSLESPSKPGNAKIKLGRNNIVTTEGNTSYAVIAMYNTQIEVGEGLQVATGGEWAYGVYAFGKDAVVNVDSGAKIRTTGMGAAGIVARTNGVVNVGEKLDVLVTGDGSAGVHAQRGGIVNLNGAKIYVKQNGSAIYSESDTADISSIVGQGVYDIQGDIRAGNNGSISLQTSKGSNIKGAAYMQAKAGSSLRFAMSGTTWDISADSNMTSLEADGGSRLIFRISGALEDDYIQLSSDNVTFDSSVVVKVILDGFDPSFGDEFKLVSSAEYNISEEVRFDFASATLAEGLGWDTSDFYNSGIIRVSDIPETSATALFLGLLALYFSVRHKKANH